MREYQRKEFDRPRLNLVRGMDGRLRSVGDRQGNAPPKVDRVSISNPGHVVTLPEAPIEQASVKRARRERARIKLPRLSLPKFERFQKGHMFAAGGVLLVVVLGATSYGALGRGKQQPIDPPTSAANTDVLDVTDTAGPEFDALLPTGKNIEDLGGWARVSPENKAPVFAFVDIVSDVQLNISQQELPESLRVDTTHEVEKLAKGFAANEKIIVGEDTVYIGTSIHGPQSVIFTQNGLLILIKSSATLTNDQWIGYISSLH